MYPEENYVMPPQIDERYGGGGRPPHGRPQHGFGYGFAGPFLGGVLGGVLGSALFPPYGYGYGGYGYGYPYYHASPYYPWYY